MEEMSVKKSIHKAWRRLAKKERRRRLRRRAAVERQADDERLRAALERSAEYLNWLQEEEKKEQEREAQEKVEHDLREKEWLEEEVRAQKEWQLLQERKLKARQQQLEQEAKIREEFEAKQEAIRKKQEEEKRKREEDIKRREQLLKEIDDYIDNGIKTPETLREVIDSQPGKELCPFFTKTGACRYGDACSRNHRRVCLSKVILIPGFYSHFSLEKNSAEYDTDIGLEFESSETRQHFREFYKDVAPELESFGRIKTLKYCCNSEIHLRGNMYVEYYTEREAARAVRRLKGRWYAGRQLNCEFVNLKSWRNAVCGMTKCPKGRACNFLHTFKNPHDEYDIKSPPRWAKQAASMQEATSSRRGEYKVKSKWEEPISCEAETEKNWRWSESPEPEVEHRSTRSAERRHHRSKERDHSQKSARDKRQDYSDRIKCSERTESSDRRRSSSRKYHDEKTRADETANGRDSSNNKTHSSRSRRRVEDDYDSSKLSRRSQSSYSNGVSDRKHRSRSKKHSDDYSRKHSRDCDKQRSKERKERSDEGSSKRKGSKNVERLNDIKASYAEGRRSKSKWDRESDGSSSADDDSADSNSSNEDGVEESNSKKRRVEKVDDWATTDSESDGGND